MVTKNVLTLSDHSSFPDIDLGAIDRAVETAFSDSVNVSAREVAHRILSALPGSMSDFERGVAVGMALTRVGLQPEAPEDGD